METEIEKIERGLNIVVGWEICEKKRKKLTDMVKKPVLTTNDLATLLQMKIPAYQNKIFNYFFE